MDNMRKYFISYGFLKDGGVGAGSIDIYRKEPIRDLRDVKLIAEFISGLSCFSDVEKVWVVSWQRYEKRCWSLPWGRK